MYQEPFNPTEKDERAHLEYVRAAIESKLDDAGVALDSQFTDVDELKKYLHESKSDMDHAEKASVRETIEQMTAIGECKADLLHRLLKLYPSPYFGRIDFLPRADRRTNPVYIGIHSFHDDKTDIHLVHDWRAPVSSMFYDFELGEAFFDAPEGRNSGSLTLKRQYRVKNGMLEFMFDTSLNIHDDVLQMELSCGADDKMKNIVATIQRDQNAIIRNSRIHALVIQGAAGSGKTSIALHRIAFLLYKFRNTITPDDILIISPNKVFADYISKVLPELGEEMIRETTMEQLADRLLGGRIRFQSFSEQVSILLEGRDFSFGERILFKAMPDFLSQLENYARHVCTTELQTEDVAVGTHTIPATWIAERFSRCAIMPYAQRILHVTAAVVDHARLEYDLEITGKARAQIRGQLKKMFANTNITTLYRNFYTWLKKPAMLKKTTDNRYEYADVFPLIYLQILLEGAESFDKIKHLVIDEMQDYTTVQYQVIAKLFRCRKTILGDHHQSVNPFNASSAESIQEILPYAECMHINKSYRSTIQITELAQKINRNEKLIPIERHGEDPEIICCADTDEELERIRHFIGNFLQSDFHSLGIICKTQPQADMIHERIRDIDQGINLLDSGSNSYEGGVIVTTAHLAKGLEFDQVIVPFCDENNYRRRIDRHMLYVACTRAMHKLVITCAKSLSPFLVP